MQADAYGLLASARHRSMPSKLAERMTRRRLADSSCREYVTITKTYALEAAKAFENLASEQEPFNFVYVSGAGATTEPGRFSALFARTKGETELALAEMRNHNPNMHASSVRPCYIDASEHEAIKPYIPTKPFAHRSIELLLGPPIKYGLKSFHSPTDSLGKVLTELALGKHQEQFVAGKGVQMNGSFPILENNVLRRLVGLQ